MGDLQENPKFMIYILDSSPIIKLKEGGYRIDESQRCFLPEEVQNEFSFDSDYIAWLKRCQFINLKIDQVDYLINYQLTLNKHNKLVSFFSLKGIGDIGVLATAKSLQKDQSQYLFQEDLTLVSDDNDLVDAMNTEFSHQIKCIGSDEFISIMY